MFKNMDDWEFSSKILKMKEEMNKKDCNTTDSIDTDIGKYHFRF